MSEAPDTLRRNAKQRYKERDYAGALEAYARLLELEDRVVPAEIRASDHSAYASALLASSRLDEAALQFERALEATPDDPRLRYKLGEVLSRLARHNEAIDQFNEAVRLQPTVAGHYWRLALELRAVGRDAESKAALGRCLELDPNHAEGLLLQIEELTLPAAERDGQDEEAVGEGRGGPMEEDVDGFFIRQTPLVVTLEAVAIFLAAVWLRTLFP